MIFSEELLQKVLAGEKTVTRRPVKYKRGPTTCADPACRPVMVPLPCKYKVGRDYALQGPPEKGSKARARTIPGYRLRILSVIERIPSGIISSDDARLEGFESPAAFHSYLAKLYRGNPPGDVHRIEFELVEEGRGG